MDSFLKRYKWITVWIIGLFCAAPAVSALSDYYCSFEVAGYFPDYRQSPISSIRFDLLTDVVFFSVYPNADGSLNTSQIDLSRQAELVSTAHAQRVRVSVCVGGWNLSDHFSAVAENAEMRAAFIAHLKDYCLAHNLNGVVLDWEPVGSDADRANYTRLIRELKTALSGHDLSLGVAVFAQGHEFEPTAIEAIDRLHVMAYDMGTPHSSYTDALAAIAHWETFGFSRDRMLLGLPFYGRNADGLYIAYDEIVQHYDPEPSADEVNGIYFNGIETIRDKTRFMVEKNYRGVMIWELTDDTTDARSLLSAGGSMILSSRPADFNCDQRFDLADLRHFGDQWLLSPCGIFNAWCEAADMDQSGGVRLCDFAKIASIWMAEQNLP